MLGAWRHGAIFAEADAKITAEQFAAKVGARAGPPYVEYQREGIDSSLGNAPNSTHYLRVGKPFNVPWQWRAGRALVRAAETYAATARRANAMNVAHQAALAWIRLAVLQEQVDVHERRAGRSKHALKLHRKRFEEGEVSGTEVSQVELEYVRQVSDLAALRARREEARAELDRLAGDGDFKPAPGDLMRLAASLEPSPLDEAWLAKASEGSILLKTAHLQTEQGRRSADLEQKLAWGRPEIEMEWEHGPSVEGADAFDAFGWRIQLPLPLDRSGRERREESRANLAAVEARERIIKREFAAGVRAAAAAASAAQQRLEAMDTVLAGLPATEHSLAEQFRLGTIHYLVYFDALSRLDDIRLQAIDARRELLEARLRLAVTLYDLSLFPLPEPPLEENP